MKALIDGDIIRYSVGFASDKTTYSVDGNYFDYKSEAKFYCKTNGIPEDIIEKIVEAEPVENCLHSVKLSIQGILDSTGADEYTIFLTGKGNFREEVATILPYKGNRDTSHKPIHYKAIKDYLIGTWDAQVVEGIEADDAMALEQTASAEPTIICSTDKDLRMVEGMHYNWKKGELYEVDYFGHLSLNEKKKLYGDGLMWFYAQMLTGDRTDNIQGVPKCGDVCAYHALNGCETELELYESVKNKYVEKFGDDVDAIIQENADLLWMQQTGRIRWEPPSESD